MQDVDFYDLEQGIMDVWGVVEDLQSVYDLSREYASDEDIQSAIMGLKVIYNQKFTALFRLYEQVLKAQHGKRRGDAVYD